MENSAGMPLLSVQSMHR